MSQYPAPRPERLRARKGLPHSLETERVVLGGFLLSHDLFTEIGAEVQAADFHRPQHQALFTLIVVIASKGPYDLATVIEEVAAREDQDAHGGVAYVISLPSSVASIETVVGHVRSLKTYATRRRLVTAGQKIVEIGATEIAEPIGLIAMSEAALQEAVNVANLDEVHPVGAYVPEVLQDIYRIQRAREEAERTGAYFVDGVSTGWRALDEKSGGLLGDQLIILAARPGAGKTALSLNLVTSALSSGVPVMYASLEMSRASLLGRMLADLGNVFYDRITGGRLEHHDMDRLSKAAEWLASAPLTVDDTAGQTVAYIVAQARRMKLKRDIGLLVVDYLQLVNMDDKNSRLTQNDKVGKVSWAFKQLSKELKIPVILISQLNRSLESRQDKRPMPSDLRDSGSIEQDADKILFIYRDEMYNAETADKGIAEVIVAKNRAGTTGTARLRWQGELQRFSDIRGEE